MYIILCDINGICFTCAILFYVMVWLIPFPLGLKSKLFCSLCAVFKWVLWRPSYYQLFQPSLVLLNLSHRGWWVMWGGTAWQTCDPVWFTSAVVVKCMQSVWPRGGDWKDWIHLFIVPYRQGTVWPETEIHCVGYLSAFVMNSSFLRPEELRQEAECSQ